MTFTELMDSLNPFSDAKGPIDSVTDTYNQLTASAKAKVKAWNIAVEKVRTTPVPNDPDLIAWRNDILNTADRIKRMILAVVSDQTAKDMGLGLGPLVIVGGVAVSGILAYIATQMTDIAKYFSRHNYIKVVAQQLIADKVPVEIAYQKATTLADKAGETKELKIFGIKASTIGMGLIVVGVVTYFLRRKA